MADALVLTLCRGNFWDHEFRSMLSWFHLQKSVLNLRVICQEAGLGIYFPGGGGGSGGRKSTLTGKCEAEERPWHRELP